MTVAPHDSAAPSLTWTRSSYSSGAGGECVEVAACPDTIRVRDSKDTTRPGLAVGHHAWAVFLGSAAERRV
ncbi:MULTISPECIES: DUF397 domain-containing protein [Streptomyces]|uniref:DUF397 domain-containing protein n=1 Tax=Streptomyces griseoaurantiacus TaxID=68213 RepID=A0A1G7GAJ4_9ACTN|nr:MULTISPECIES: DUF397 domain-containing protein [Streptomyces]MDX3089157.1 DUF397 domain-containing protein [Streptomyces sp. ME12-02E]MDX3332554.1 DUF397 domain-containing protein [Streptomyces sp. ME02-6978a]SDE85168.1 protein of unknown function [Streptomyces jietaisiensis]